MIAELIVVADWVLLLTALDPLEASQKGSRFPSTEDLDEHAVVRDVPGAANLAVPTKLGLCEADRPRTYDSRFC